MLMDAERIEREISRVMDARKAKLTAFAFGAPEVLDQIADRLLEELRSQRSTFTPEQLIAYALERQKQVNAHLVS